jgi:predicted PurR-regulated permease PerM
MNDDRAGRQDPPTAAPPASRATTGSLWQRAAPIYLALVLAFLTAVGIYLLFQLRHVLLILFVSLLFAAATSRPASRLQRWRIPQAFSVAMIYLLALAILAGIAYFVLPPLIGQVAGLGENLPAYVDRYQQLRERYDEIRRDYPGLGSFDEQSRAIAGRIVSGLGERLAALPTQLFGLFLDVLSVFVISMLLVTNRHRLLQLILSLVHPEHRAQTRDVLVQMWQRVGYYLRAKLIVMVIVGAITYVALLLIGVPFPLLLAIVVAFGELIPRAGPWLARIPLLAIAALEGWQALALAAAASILIENLKGYAISPIVEGQQLDIHPLLVFISVLIGSSLLGFAGAFVAVPAAAMIQVLFEEVVIPWRRGRLAATGPAGDPRPDSTAREQG